MHELRDRLRELFGDGDARDRAADEHRVVRLQARPARRRRPRLRLPFPPEPALDRRAAPAAGHRRAGARLRARPARARAFLDELERLFALLLPAYVHEGKAYLSIGIGCTGGRHRSVVIADELARAARRRTRRSRRRSSTATSIAAKPWRELMTPATAERGPRSSRSAAGTASPRAARDPPVRGLDHRGRQRRRRRRLVGPAAPRPRRLAAGRPAQVPGRARRRQPWAARVRAPLRRRRARRPRARQPGARRARPRPSATSRGARRSRPARRRGRAGAARRPPNRSCSRPRSADRASRGRSRCRSRPTAASAGSSWCPPTRRASPDAVAAIRAADQVVLAPGSLVHEPARRCSCVPGIRDAVAADAGAGRAGRQPRGRRSPRPRGSTAPTTCAAVLEHGARVDTFLYDRRRRARRSTTPMPARSGVEPVAAARGAPGGIVARSANIGDGAVALL